VIVVDVSSEMLDDCAHCDMQKLAILQWGVFDLLDAVYTDMPLGVVVVTDKARTLHNLAPLSTAERWKIRRELMALQPVSSRRALASVPSELRRLFGGSEPTNAGNRGDQVLVLTVGGRDLAAHHCAALAREHPFRLHVIGIRSNPSDRGGLESLARNTRGTASFVESNMEYVTSLTAILAELEGASFADQGATRKLRGALDACYREKGRLCCELEQREALLIEIRSSQNVNLKKALAAIETLVETCLKAGHNVSGIQRNGSVHSRLLRCLAGPVCHVRSVHQERTDSVRRHDVPGGILSREDLVRFRIEAGLRPARS
jgi:hypothetical protein